MTTPAIDPIFQGITLPPGFTLTRAYEEGPRPDRSYIVVKGPTLPNSDGSGETFNGTFVLEPPEPANRHEAARLLLTMCALFAIHEAIEFTQYDGRRVATPHPEGDGEEDRLWDWMTERVTGLLAEYEERWP